MKKKERIHIGKKRLRPSGGKNRERARLLQNDGKRKRAEEGNCSTLREKEKGGRGQKAGVSEGKHREKQRETQELKGNGKGVEEGGRSIPDLRRT